EGEIGSARRNLVRDLNTRRVHFTEQETGEAVPGVGYARQPGDQRSHGEDAGGAAVANLVVGPGAEFAAEFEGMLALEPGERIENLAIENRGLKSVDGAVVA